jgi:hypothetical protein
VEFDEATRFIRSRRRTVSAQLLMRLDEPNPNGRAALTSPTRRFQQPRADVAHLADEADR